MKNKGKVHQEGLDQNYTVKEDFWINYKPLQQYLSLPSFNDFKQNYPGGSDGNCIMASNVFEMIGGELINPNFTNACAARVSKSLNYSGIAIPKINGLTFKGADGKYYFLGASHLNNWLIKTFGEPTYSLNQNQAGTDGQGFRAIINAKKGIYIMIPQYPRRFGASGHADIYDGSNFNCGSYFDPPGGLYKASLWTLDSSVRI